MGRGKRKKNRGSDGGRSKAPSGKPNPSATALEPEERDDPDQNPNPSARNLVLEERDGPNQIQMADLGITGGNSDEGRADGYVNQAEDLELEERDGPSQTQMADLGISGGNSVEGRANGYVNQAGIVGGDLDEGRDRSAYLVACHWDWATYSEPFSVYKVDVAASSPVSPVKRKRLRRIKSLPTSARGKTFTSVRTMSRAWIVCVGGDPGETIIFDTKTNEVIRGPILNSAKWCPVLMAVGDKLFAMSKIPCWIKDPDFPPWFEVLDLSQARVVTVDDCSHLEGCSWSELPHPPCFPWKISPIGYNMLPVVVLTSYVVVGTFIVVSFNQPWGTYAFDTSSLEWHKVDNKRLPFIGRAVPQGSFFLGLSKEGGPINAYLIDLTTSNKQGHAPNFSITVLRVKYMEREVDAGSCFFSLEDGRFCSFSFSLDSGSVTLHPEKHELFPKAAHLYLRTYQIQDPLHLESSEETMLSAKQEVAISSQWERSFKVSSKFHGFSPFAFTLLSV